VEVDDPTRRRIEEHRQNMKLIQERFQFGKHISLRTTERRNLQTGMRMIQKDDYSFVLSMKDYIRGRLHEIPLSPVRKRQRDQPITEDTTRCDNLLERCWGSAKCRPHRAGPVSILQRRRDCVVQGA
jgi:hypothetical protein